MNNLPNEEWKDLEMYKGIYQVSNLGRIRSIDRIIYKKDRPWNLKGKILSPKTNKKGYVNVLLSKDGISKTYILSRLIGITFLENPENKEQINHKDGNKQDNSVNNLEWSTQSENQKHKYAVLGYPAPTSGKKLIKKEYLTVNQYDIEGNLIKEWGSIKAISEFYKVTSSFISSVCRGRKPTCKGFIFKYKD